MLEFYRTMGGKRFIDSTVPRLTVALEKIAESMGKNEAQTCEKCGTVHKTIVVKFGDNTAGYQRCPGCGNL